MDVDLDLKVDALGAEVSELRRMLDNVADSIEDAQTPIGENGSSDDGLVLPFQVYLSGGYVCVRPGHHLWWNANTNTVEGASAPLSKAVADTWVAPASATVIFLKRIYNSDGTATVSLEYANTTYAAVIGAVTATEARWVLATLASGSIQKQWWTGGDIYELRVA